MGIYLSACTSGLNSVSSNMNANLILKYERKASTFLSSFLFELSFQFHQAKNPTYLISMSYSCRIWFYYFILSASCSSNRTRLTVKIVLVLSVRPSFCLLPSVVGRPCASVFRCLWNIGENWQKIGGKPFPLLVLSEISVSFMFALWKYHWPTGSAMQSLALASLHSSLHSRLEILFCRRRSVVLLLKIFSFFPPPDHTNSPASPLPQPEGRPGSSDVSTLSGISGLLFDSIFLWSLVILPSPVAHSVFLLVSAFGPVCCLLSRNVFKKVFSRDRLYCITLFLVVF